MLVSSLNPLEKREYENAFTIQSNFEERSIFAFEPLNSKPKTPIEELKSDFELAKDEQGIVGSIFDFFKNVFHTEYSSNTIEKEINSLNENSTQEEIQAVKNKIKSYSSRQDTMVDTTATTVASVSAGLFGAKVGAIIGSTIFPGIGTAFGAILGGAILGIVSKVGINQLENCTDKIAKNEWLNDKDFTKDIITGAAAGGLAVAANNLTAKIANKLKGAFNLSAKGISIAKDGTSNIAKTAFYNGVSEGVAGGAAATFESDAEYIINSAVDSEKDFNFGELIQTTLSSFLMGGLLSGGFGALSGKKTAKQINARIQEYKEISPFDIQNLSDEAFLMSNHYKTRTNQATAQIEDAFYDLDSVDTICGRAKGENSVFEKLAKKRKKNELRTTTSADCYEAIGDAYGTRICTKNVSQQQAQGIIDDVFKGSSLSCSCDDFCRYLSGDTANLSDDLINFLQQSNGDEIIRRLKTMQMDEVVDRLIEKISSGDLVLTELNNYGDEITAYFTKEQLEKIADTYFEKYTVPLNIFTKEDVSFGIWRYDDFYEAPVFKTDRLKLISDATKETGYSAAQINLRHELNNYTEIGLGELQIRGLGVNSLAEKEHIIYDILANKIKPNNRLYSGISKTLNELSAQSLTKYKEYLTQLYRALRLNEIGIPAQIPKIGTGFYTKSGAVVDMSSLAYEVLMKLK